MEKLLPGEGVITLTPSGLSDLAFSYPLKLIKPTRRFIEGVTAVYVISYGGGLVAGDRVKLSVSVTGGCTLVMLTQGAWCAGPDSALISLTRGHTGSTKVFKTRAGRYLTDTAVTKSHNGIVSATRQLLDVAIAADSTLVLLPAPVTCFSRASYSQRQAFDLRLTANLVLLDWYTSGRMDMGDGVGEAWQFQRYRSENEVSVDGRRVARDVLLLEDDSNNSDDRSTPSYRARVDPYSCYATILLVGPRTMQLRRHLHNAFETITQYKQAMPYSMLWSFSALEGGEAGIARCAGDSTETVKDWIVQVLQDGGIQDIIGVDLWKVAFT